MSLRYVEQKRNESVCGALIGWFIRTGQSEQRTHSRFIFVQLGFTFYEIETKARTALRLVD
ncbi:hypothetical protein SFRURICE_006112 [Spodoptera frugiperda]|nr:hypothetical protein SFRURICE_006112 [Spodoptera frugiperda]